MGKAGTHFSAVRAVDEWVPVLAGTAMLVLRRRRIQIPPRPLESEVPVRDLASYDTAFGVDLDGGAA